MNRLYKIMDSYQTLACDDVDFRGNMVRLGLLGRKFSIG